VRIRRQDINDQKFSFRERLIAGDTLSSATVRPDDLSEVVEINRVCLPENYSAYFFMEVYKSCPEASWWQNATTRWSAT